MEEEEEEEIVRELARVIGKDGERDKEKGRKRDTGHDLI